MKGTKDGLKKIKLIYKKIKKLNLNKVFLYFDKVLNTFENNIEIDLSMTSDVDYYTGIYFEAITPKLGRNLGSGGRYDQLINKFGYDIPAVGFSLCLEDLLLVLDIQGKIFPKFKNPKLILAGKNIKKTFGSIDKTHRSGKHAALKL